MKTGKILTGLLALLALGGCVAPYDLYRGNYMGTTQARVVAQKRKITVILEDQYITVRTSGFGPHAAKVAISNKGNPCWVEVAFTSTGSRGISETFIMAPRVFAEVPVELYPTSSFGSEVWANITPTKGDCVGKVNKQVELYDQPYSQKLVPVETLGHIYPRPLH